MTRSTKHFCKGCSCDISHKHPNAKFHNQRCKDAYWNRVNPRGLGIELTTLVRDRQNDEDDYDGSWDAHACVTEDMLERDEEIRSLRRRMRK